MFLSLQYLLSREKYDVVNFVKARNYVQSKEEWRFPSGNIFFTFRDTYVFCVFVLCK